MSEDHTCTVASCGRAPVARGMCMSHYKQWRRTGEVPEPQREIGSPSGHGQWGILERTEDGVLCHECGQWRESIGAHLAAHDMTAAEYRQRHGLARMQPLVSLRLSREQSERARSRLGSPAWQRLEEARDPAGAAAARESLHDPAPAVRAARSARGAATPPPPRERRARICTACGGEIPAGERRRTCSDECRLRRMRAARVAQRRHGELTEAESELLQSARSGAALDELVRSLQARGASSAAIGRALGRTPRWMSDRYPRG